jgi:hypothetical protein
MNAPTIQFSTPSGRYEFPNRWERLSPELFLFLCSLLDKYSKGELSFRELHIAYVCSALQLDPEKIKGSSAYENIYLLSDQVDFIFAKDNKLNACFLEQLIPELCIRKKYKKIKYKGYTINKAHNTLTCSLTALQFIEAYGLIGCQEEKLPLLAAILYHPGQYTSESAHALSEKFSRVDPVTLNAIALNFSSFVNFLFTRTDFRLLHSRESGEKKNITTSMADGLYNLSADGLGDAEKIEQLPVLKYLSILRKKLIESVRAMHVAEMDLTDIEVQTGLSIKTIKQII